MVTAIEVIVNSTFIVSFDVALIIVRNHASLENLDYEHSGHTGFASSAALAGKADKSELTPKLDKDNFGWVIADNTYNPTYSYNKGDTVFYVDTVNPYRGYIYVAKQDIPAPAGNFDYTKWETTTLERLIWLKQDKLTAGTGITITNNVISATGGGGEVTEQELTEKLALKQDKLTAGSGISISGSTISAIHSVDVVETGALVKKLYNDIKDYKLVFCYGYRDALSAPNQFMFAFMPDQLQVDGEDLQFLAMAGSSNWQYPIRVKRNSDGYVYWWSAYDYSGNTTFFVTKIVGIK